MLHIKLTNKSSLAHKNLKIMKSQKSYPIKNEQSNKLKLDHKKSCLFRKEEKTKNVLNVASLNYLWNDLTDYLNLLNYIFFPRAFLNCFF
jgi:hypothetical protein